MGGYGSGKRIVSKQRVEDQIMIDIRWMKKQGLLIPGTSGHMSWECRGQETNSIGYTVAADRLTLKYNNSDKGGECEYIEDIIFFGWTPCNYGGQRQWFLCPTCDKRVALVYAGKYYRCRHCHNLTYASQLESASDRLRRRSRKIRNRMEGGDNLFEPFPSKPKNMHWATYWRLRKEADQASTRSLLIGMQQLGLDMTEHLEVSTHSGTLCERAAK